MIDVKRAIRWTRQNIASFGGDPDFIVFSGDSAGAHLAAMASLTANDPQYQPGFEQVDTSCRGVVSVNGVLDLTYSNMINYFSKQVAMLSDVNMDFLNKHSPTTVIQQTKDCVPYLVLAGQRDALVNSDVSVKFKKQFDEGKKKMHMQKRALNNDAFSTTQESMYTCLIPWWTPHQLHRLVPSFPLRCPYHSNLV